MGWSLSEYLLRLKGKWLRDSGFDSGTQMKLFILKDQMIITRADD